MLNFRTSTFIENHRIHERISELLKEIKKIRAKNEREKPAGNGVGSGDFELRWTRLQEIKCELERLAKKRPQSERGSPNRGSR
jgi:hypothetical protein